MKNEGKLTGAKKLLEGNGLGLAMSTYRLAWRGIEIVVMHAYKQLFDEYFAANPDVPYIDLQCIVYTDGVAVTYLVEAVTVSEYSALHDVLQGLVPYEQVFLGYWSQYVSQQHEVKGLRSFTLRFTSATMPEILDVNA